MGRIINNLLTVIGVVLLVFGVIVILQNPPSFLKSIMPASPTQSGIVPTPGQSVSGLPRATSSILSPVSTPYTLAGQLPDEQIIGQLLLAETEAVVRQDIDHLQIMWSSDGVVTDANRTPNNSSDDKIWRGWPAIRDRYVNIVFPSGPVFAERLNIRVMVSDDTASAVADVKIGSTILKDNEKWTFRKVDKKWKITSLTFGLAP